MSDEVNLLERDWRQFLATSFGDQLTEQQEAALHMSFAAGAVTTFRRAQAAGAKQTMNQAVRAMQQLEREINAMKLPYALAAELRQQEGGADGSN